MHMHACVEQRVVLEAEARQGRMRAEAGGEEQRAPWGQCVPSEAQPAQLYRAQGAHVSVADLT